jgi:DNA-binding response OmpR family regulator
MRPANRPPDDPTTLSGVSVLIVEDDYFVANECATVLRARGARVLGPVPDVQGAREQLRVESPDCVLLDVNLKGEMVFEFARDLLARQVPAVFTTGYDSSFLPESLRGARCLKKPVEGRDLIHAIRVETRVP